MEIDSIPGEGRMERKKRELRQKIINIAMKLFEQQGFSNTTMEQIAEEADVARKTLYNYFPVKEAIADEYVKGISNHLAQEASSKLQNLPDTRSRLLSALNNAYGWVEINPELTGIVLAYRFKTTYQVSGNELEERGTHKIIAEIIRQGQEAGEIRSDVQLKLLVRYIDLLRGTIVWEWLQDTSSFELREEISRMVDIVLHGISTGKSKVK
ncbi:transcriptional regulator, tetr family [hydrocarbon metagenome]|uniref:Transcriptional regulator, tetr family n=1 Tax=hydrocarbon metagenome TaxID=938273 RepID=A0A0W8E2A6_9ZZZZ